jgi:hypothetical protein
MDPGVRAGPVWRRRGLGNALAAAFSGAVGLAWWSASLNAGTYLTWYVVGTALSVPVLVAVLDVKPHTLILPMVLVPFAAAGWTAPRGDNDGLWVLVYVYLLAWGGPLYLLALSLRTLRHRIGRAPLGTWLRGRLPGTTTVAATVAAVAVTVAAITLLAIRLAGPWSELRSALASYPVPAGYTIVGSQRAGSPLCETSCNATLSLVLVDHQDPETECDTLGNSLQHWPGTSEVTRGSPIHEPGFWQTCFYRAILRSNGGARVVEATAIRPPGQAPRVLVTAVDGFWSLGYDR